MSDHKPFLLVLSAPSGCGKTTLLRKLREGMPEIGFSISHTTRPIRPGERDGVDYFFVDHLEFTQMQNRGAFIESATVHANSYGTSFASIDSRLQEGSEVVLDIDVQGMQLLKSRNRYDLVSIFIMPPGLNVLEARLRRRGTDSDAVIRQRLLNAEAEISAASFYDYQVVNDNLEVAFSQLSSIIVAERLRTLRLK